MYTSVCSLKEAQEASSILTELIHTHFKHTLACCTRDCVTPSLEHPPPHPASYIAPVSLHAGQPDFVCLIQRQEEEGCSKKPHRSGNTLVKPVKCTYWFLCHCWVNTFSKLFKVGQRSFYWDQQNTALFWVLIMTWERESYYMCMLEWHVRVMN